jgi:acyl-coenzyme A thioesterase PaaI-like protein
MALRHHDLCFGCGPANLFGLQLELERRPDGSVVGRCFVKQDHQGPHGEAHPGIVGAALEDAMALAAAPAAAPPLAPARLELDFHAPAPVGAFLLLEAAAEPAGDGGLGTRGTARREDGELVAEARGTLARPAG